MKQLKIEVPEGYEIDKTKSSFDNIVFKKVAKPKVPKEKPLPKTWEELEKVKGYYTSAFSSIEETIAIRANTKNRNTFLTKEQAEAAVALAQLSQLREVYRKGWKPDWTNTQLYKWCILPKDGVLFIDVNCVTSYFLAFETKACAQEFVKNFKDLIVKALPLMT